MTKTIIEEKIDEPKVNVPAEQPTTRGGALALPEDAALLMEELSGDGNEGVKQDDLATPFFRVVQSNSPVIMRDVPHETARPGMFLHSISEEVWPGNPGLVFIDCFYESLLMEWVPRTKGGGLVGVYPSDDPRQFQVKRDPADNKDYLPNGNILSKVAQHYVLVLDPPSDEFPRGRMIRGVLPMAGTQLKKSRKVNFMLQSIIVPSKDGSEGKKAPRFGSMMKVTTVRESNDKGSWFGMEFVNMGLVKHVEVLREAKAYKEAVASGRVRVVDAEGTNPETGDNIPF